MLAACSPSTRSYFETVSTLQYAVRAKMIKTQPKTNYDIVDEPEDEVEDKKKSPTQFDYLPRFVRVAAQHRAETDRGGGPASNGGIKSARV